MDGKGCLEKIGNKMNFITNFILNSKNEVRDTYIWNMIAATSSSFQSMVILLIMTRAGHVNTASYVAIGFAAANLMMTIGKFGIRNFQATDVSEKYEFRCYKQARFITVVGMALCSMAYCMVKYIESGYPVGKTIVVLLLCIYKTVESLEDVYHGRLQQKGRLDIASKIWAIRNLAFIVEFLVIFLALKKLEVTLVISVATTMVLCWFLNRMPKQFYLGSSIYISAKKNWKELLRACFPIAVAAFLLMYISNAPKYIVDTVISDEGQSHFNILFMTVFVVTLFSNFIYNPILNRLAILWEEGNKRELSRRIGIVIGIVAGIVAVGIIFAEVIGRKLLGIIYGVSLEQYKQELRLMLISGGLIAIMNLLYMMIILLRRQKVFYFVFMIATVALFVMGKRILNNWELEGLCWFYNIVLLAVDLAFVVCVLYFIHRGKD